MSQRTKHRSMLSKLTEAEILGGEHVERSQVLYPLSLSLLSYYMLSVDTRVWATHFAS